MKPRPAVICTAKPALRGGDVPLPLATPQSSPAIGTHTLLGEAQDRQARRDLPAQAASKAVRVATSTRLAVLVSTRPGWRSVWFEFPPMPSFPASAAPCSTRVAGAAHRMDNGIRIRPDLAAPQFRLVYGSR